MKKRYLSLSLALLYLFAMVFSVTLIGTQANHEHIGENDCAICAQLQTCADGLVSPQACARTEKTSRLFSASRRISKSFSSAKKREEVSTPVSLKVKLTS